jgi:hypothetical protein
MTLYDLVAATFEAGNESEPCRRVFEELGTDCLHLSVDDGEDVYVLFDDGTASVREGTPPDSQECHAIGGTVAAFDDLFEGRHTIVEAAWDGQIQAEVYHGRPDLYFALQQSIRARVPTLDPEPF